MRWLENVRLWLSNIGSNKRANANETRATSHITDMATREFLAFAKASEKAKVQYLILGGANLTFRGLARITYDIDIWVNPTAENMKALERCLISLGYKELETLRDYMPPAPRFWHISGPIDIMTVCHQAFDFQSCYNRRSDIVFEGQILPLMHILDVKDLKLRARRDQDYRDAILIDNFLRAHGQPTEWPDGQA